MKTAEFARSLGLAPPEPFTRENVLSRLKAAVEYGFTASAASVLPYGTMRY